VLRTHFRAIADQRAAPDAFLRVENRRALVPAAVARVGVVAMEQSQRRRPGEVGLEPVLRARGVAEQAVDALRVLVVLVELCRRLNIRGWYRWLIERKNVSARIRCESTAWIVDNRRCLVNKIDVASEMPLTLV